MIWQAKSGAVLPAGSWFPWFCLTDMWMNLVVVLCVSCALVYCNVDHVGGIDNNVVLSGEVLRLVQGVWFKNYAVHQHNRTSCF